jgi:hypothetical protein
MSNRLTVETSPYLQQHADNPVDWLPWGAEALALVGIEHVSDLVYVFPFRWEDRRAFARVSDLRPKGAEATLDLRAEQQKVAAVREVVAAHIDLTRVAPDVLTTRQVADRIVEIYWPHTLPFGGQGLPRVLRQNAGGQAEIVSTITRFRERHAADPSVPRWESRVSAPDACR